MTLADDALITLDQAAGLIPGADADPCEVPRIGHRRTLTDRINTNIYRAFHEKPCVYFVGNHRAVKIGVTESIGRRVSELDRGYEPVRILLLVRGSYMQERELHQRFADLYVRKEWFVHAGKLAEFIARERVKFA
jgi:hypothetical protein